MSSSSSSSSSTNAITLSFPYFKAVATGKDVEETEKKLGELQARMDTLDKAKVALSSGVKQLNKANESDIARMKSDPECKSWRESWISYHNKIIDTRKKVFDHESKKIQEELSGLQKQRLSLLKTVDELIKSSKDGSRKGMFIQIIHKQSDMIYII